MIRLLCSVSLALCCATAPVFADTPREVEARVLIPALDLDGADAQLQSEHEEVAMTVELLAKAVAAIPSSDQEIAAALGVSPQRLAVWLRAARSGESLRPRDAAALPTEEQLDTALMPLIRSAMGRLTDVASSLPSGLQQSASGTVASMNELPQPQIGQAVLYNGAAALVTAVHGPPIISLCYVRAVGAGAQVEEVSFVAYPAWEHATLSQHPGQSAS